MIKTRTPSASSLAAANEGQEEPSPAAVDAYWEDISLQASVRLARVDEERKHLAAQGEITRPPIGRRFAPWIHRPVLMVAVGTILFAAIAYLAALPP
ncbi:MAG: hypothetical protein ISP45_30935 [Reyranella sp.]|nr:hypothetical protein [Reyranella sp.]